MYKLVPLAPLDSVAAVALRRVRTGERLTLSHGRWLFEEQYRHGWSRMGLGWPDEEIAPHSVEWLLEDGFAAQEDYSTRIAITPRGVAFLRDIDESVRASMSRRVMTTLPIVKLDEVIAELRRDFTDIDGFCLAQHLSARILAVVFGWSWIERHWTRTPAPTAFFRSGTRESDYDATVGALRLISLAEMVFNLQHHHGVEKSVAMIRGGDLEGGYAELEIAKWLSTNKIDFQFRLPSGTSKDDYDLKISIAGHSACADTKCKIESTVRSEKSLIDSLNHGRRQLPDDQPKILFVKIPEQWLIHDEDELARFLDGATVRFFTRTTRVVSVKYLISANPAVDETISQVVHVMEFTNPHHRFNRQVSWNVFREVGDLDESWVSLLKACDKHPPRESDEEDGY